MSGVTGPLITPLEARSYQPLQEIEAAVPVDNLIKDPESWDDHLKRSAASSVKTAIYGSCPIDSKDDPLVVRINDLMHRLVRATLPGAFMVDIFPALKNVPTWVPFTGWKKEGLEWHRKDTDTFQVFMDDVRGGVVEGTSKPCFAGSLVENQERHDLTRKEESWLAVTMFGAGAETTAAALSVFILAMRLYPAVMRKARAEIDAVVGRDRMPTFADRDRLPYIGARLDTNERVLYTNFIPKGTLVIANVWAMNRDPELFPDFDEFRPERFLDAAGITEVVPPDTHYQREFHRRHVTYGFGRRVCIGMNIANQTLFIDITSMLWAAMIEPAHDANGAVIVPSRTECVGEGLVVCVNPSTLIHPTHLTKEVQDHTVLSRC
ncbi:cytochrome P450 [Mycena galericulata]|nr:cytochrome P450 [Mycena galericulata]